MKTAVIFTGLVNVDENLVGTAVIYKKIADILLSRGYRVDMVVPRLAGLKSRINCHLWDERNNKRLINSSSLVVFGAYPPIEPMYYAYLKKKTIATYLWSIAPVASLEFKDFSSLKKQKDLHQYISASYNLSLLLSDKIFCRNERVRDLVLGSLIALGRVDLANYRKDPTLRDLLAVAPFGLDKRAPRHKKDIYRGVVEGIDKNDFLLIWNGGIWNWNDGRTPVEAMKLLRDKYRNKDIKLIFQGFKHPDKEQGLSNEAEKTLMLARKYRLENDRVFFIEDWIPHKERGNFLTECNAGIVAAPDIPEANLFLKTRIYDYLWAGLPVILGDNEAFASLVNKLGLGLSAKCGLADDFAQKMITLKKQKDLYNEIVNNIKNVKKELTWKKTLKKVDEYIMNPGQDRQKYAAGRTLFHHNIKCNIDIIKRRD